MALPPTGFKITLTGVTGLPTDAVIAAMKAMNEWARQTQPPVAAVVSTGEVVDSEAVQ